MILIIIKWGSINMDTLGLGTKEKVDQIGSTGEFYQSWEYRFLISEGDRELNYV